MQHHFGLKPEGKPTADKSGSADEPDEAEGDDHYFRQHFAAGS